MRPACIIDLDNCVSNDFWRQCRIQYHHPKPNDRYWEYHDACHLDLPGQSQLTRVRELSRNYRLLVFTARPEVVREKTRKWLNKWGIPHDGLYMRPDNDHRGSVDLKRAMLKWVPDFQIEYAVDDRQDILDMYLSMGVPRVERLFIVEQGDNHP
jgi:hypothetical protein